MKTTGHNLQNLLLLYKSNKINACRHTERLTKPGTFRLSLTCKEQVLRLKVNIYFNKIV